LNLRNVHITTSPQNVFPELNMVPRVSILKFNAISDTGF